MSKLLPQSALTSNSSTGRPKDSPVWDYFNYSIDLDSTTCRVKIPVNGDPGATKPCGKILKGKNPTNMKVHLSSTHKSEYGEFLEKHKKASEGKRKQSMLSNGTVRNENPMPLNLQPKILTFTKKGALHPTTSNKYCQKMSAMVDMFASTGLAVNVVENEAFRSFCSSMDDMFPVPSRTKLESEMSAKAEMVQTKIKERIEHAPFVTLATDLWTKRGYTESYMAVSCCYFNDIAERAEHVMLNLYVVQHPHTGEAIASKLNETILKWNINSDKVLAVVTDNGSNMVKAVRIMKTLQQNSGSSSTINFSTLDSSEGEDSDMDNELEQSRGSMMEVEQRDLAEHDASMLPPSLPFRRLPCLPHTLQLVVGELKKQPSYCSVIEKTKKLVAKVKKSSVATQSLVEAAQLTLVMDCPTRWSSTFLMVSRLLKVREPLEKVLQEMKWDSLLTSEWSQLESIQKLLMPFAEHTKTLEADANTLSSVLPAILDLELSLEHAKQSIDRVLEPCVYALQMSIATRFCNFRNPMVPNFEVLPAAATLLDPTYAEILLIPCNRYLLSYAKEFVVEQLHKLQQIRQLKMSEAESTPEASTSMATTSNEDLEDAGSVARPIKRFRFLSAAFLEVQRQPAHHVGRKFDGEAELENYMKTLEETVGSNSGFQFWSEKKTEYPLLSCLASSILACPASEAFVERTFSTCGWLTNGRRNRLSKTLEKKVLLKHNLPFVS